MVSVPTVHRHTFLLQSFYVNIAGDCDVINVYIGWHVCYGKGDSLKMSNQRLCIIPRL